MRNPVTITGKIVLEYLEKFPNAKHLTLAKKIYKENKAVFKSVEQVRVRILYYTGNNGSKDRKKLADRRFVREDTISSGENKYKLPESDALEYPIFRFPKAQNKILICGDFHAPYHDNLAITAMVDWAKEHEINTILLNGDVIDAHQLSFFVRDPRKRRFVEEREISWKMLDAMQNALPNVVFYWKQGNHEERYENYLKVKAPEIFDMSEFQFDIVFRLGERGIIWIGDKIRIEAGHLGIYHGHELGRGGGGSLINVSRWLYMRSGESIMANHFHKTSEFTQTTTSGKIISCNSLGCMCHLNPEWMPNNNWNHGFARAKVEPNRDFELTNLKIHEGKVL